MPVEKAVLNTRPYPKTSGPRHVPVLASTNGIPFLRLTKPQPPALSRVLRQRVARKQIILDTKIYLANWWTPLCYQEDEWDRLIGALPDAAEDSVTWAEAMQMNVTLNRLALKRDLEKDQKIARKMRRLVEEETKLANQEGMIISRGRRRKPLKLIQSTDNSVGQRYSDG